MTHIEAEAEIPLPAAEYWSIRNTPEFYEIECRVLNNASKKMLEEEYDENGTVLRSKLATKPDVSFVPSYLLNMLPGEDKSIVFYDDVEYVYDDPLTPYAFRCRTTPNVFADRADITGYVRIIPNPDGRTCKQTVSMDVRLNAWGVASVVGTLVGKGISDGYAKLDQMVEQWKLIAAGAFLKGLPSDETQWTWDADAESTQHMDMAGALDDDGVSVLSGEAFYEPEKEAPDDDDSGLGKTDSMSTDSEGRLSQESLLVIQQPAMHGMGAGDLVKLGTERPPQQAESSVWALCGLGSYFW